MNQEQNDALLWRVLRERKETQQTLTRLRNEATHFGQIFGTLAELLKQRPFTVIFEDDAASARFSQSEALVFKMADIDGRQILAITNQIRETMEKLVQLEEQIRDLGF
jgi:hypothetical protein